jgi:hypothetical protein
MFIFLINTGRHGQFCTSGARATAAVSRSRSSGAEKKAPRDAAGAKVAGRVRRGAAIAR